MTLYGIKVCYNFLNEFGYIGYVFFFRSLSVFFSSLLPRQPLPFAVALYRLF